MDTPKFIIIDDDKIVIKLCNMLVNKIFGNVDFLAFPNPVEGLEYLRTAFLNHHNKQPALLFLDINMPEMTGWELLEHYDALDEKIKNAINIFILSSSVDDRDMERARLNKYVIDYIVKPITKESLQNIANSNRREKMLLAEGADTGLF
jgi:two-component SAPR family response regulator